MINAEKLTEHTYGSMVYMKILLDGKVEEVNHYCGASSDWSQYRTSGDNDPNRRKKIIEAFKYLY